MKTSAIATFRSIFSFFLLFSASFLNHCCYAAPIAPQDTEPPTQCACNVASDANIINDASCLQDELHTYARDLGSHLTSLPCEIDSFSPFSQPIHILNALASRVDALSQIQDSAINASYSDNMCRLKESIIPYLNETLSSICGCSDEACETSVPFDISYSDDSLEYRNEYCLVNNIQISLGNLLNRITLDKHVKPPVMKQCLVNISTRFQLEKLRNDIDEAGKDLVCGVCPVLGDTSSLAPECALTLSGLNELIPTLNEHGQESLAQQLKLVLPKMSELHQSNNDICTLAALPDNMNECCTVSFLKSFYFTAYHYIKMRLQSQNILPEYTPCPAPDDMAAFQEVNGEPTIVPTEPKFIISPPIEGIPNRPTRN